MDAGLETHSTNVIAKHEIDRKTASFRYGEIEGMRALVEALVSQDAIEMKFTEVVREIVKKGFFRDTWELRQPGMIFRNGELTASGKSYFGKMFTRYGRIPFPTRRGTFYFSCKSRGNARRFVLEEF